ncbi:MAG: HYR domain-containing protein [Blastocatellales bacterium]
MGTLHKRTHRPLALGALFLLLGVVGWHLPQLGSAVMAYSNHAIKTARAAISNAPAVKAETVTPRAASLAMTPTAPMQQTPAQQNLAAAQAALDSAKANLKANPSKENAQNLDSALATYNAAAAARVAEIKSILNNSVPGGTGSTDPNPVPLPANYDALVAELKMLGGLPILNAPAPNIIPETEPNNTGATANTLNLASQNVTIVSGSITAGDQDWFKITVAANSRVWLYVDTGGTQNAGATSRDSQVTLFQSDGTTQIEFDDDDGSGNGCDGTNETGLASAIGGRLVTGAGDYLIKVNAFSATGVINPYKLFVVATTTTPVAETEPNNTSATANSIVTNAQTVGVASGNLTAGDLDFYSVQTTAGNILYINADGNPERDATDTDMVVELRDTNGTTILFSADSSFLAGDAPFTESFCYLIPSTGTYYVVVRHFSASGTGTYNLMVAAGNSDAPSNCPPDTVSATLGGASNFTKVSGSTTQRLFRDGITLSSVCGVPRTQTGPLAAVRTYDAYTVPVGGTGTQCFTVTYTRLAGATGEMMVGFFQNTFNPANLTQNWLGDNAASITPAGSDTPRTVSVNVPSGNNLVIVVMDGGSAAGTAFNYTLQISGFIAGCAAPCSITCPTNIVVSNDANQCGATVTYTTPTTMGTCGTVTCNPASGSFFPVGTTTVNCSTTGAVNGLQSCSFTVKVNDTQPPSITCPSNIFVGTTGTSQVVNYPAPAVSDNCPGLQPVVCTPASGTAFPLGVTTVTCTVKDAVNNTASCSFQITVNKLTVGAITDPLACTGPGNVLNGSFSVTNNGNVAQAVAATVALSSSTTMGQLLALPGTCVASIGTCTVVNATTISYTGNLTAGQVATISYKLQVNDVAPTGTVLTSTVTASFNGGAPVQGSASTTVTCQQVGPGPIYPARSEVTDQKPGSVLVFPIYTSAVGQSTQDSRISITNTHPNLRAWVHLFFVADNCSVSDAFLCLTPNQTSSFLASDLDPGTTGYMVAVASDGNLGCPIDFNYLIGDEYVKFTTGHAANLAAESISAIAGSAFWASCDANSNSATLRFDGISYNLLPNVVSVDNIGSRADGNDTLVVLNRINGDLRTGPTGLGNVFGVFYDDAENALSFTLNSAACQYRFRVDNTTPRITPRFDQFVGAGRSGWIKMYQRDGHAILGAAINFNPNTSASAGAFTGGHNLHHLTLTNTASYIIPIFPPSC